jgi:hypothetical protein
VNGYFELWQALAAKARQKIAAGHQAQGFRVGMLSDACSMLLAPESINEPYKAYYVMNGARGVLPDDFSHDQISHFSKYAWKTRCTLLRARLADIVWLCKKPRDPNFALLAIDTYRNVPLDQDSLARNGRECWSRAIKLSHSLKKGAGNRLNDIRSDLLMAFGGTTEGERFTALWLSQLLADVRVGSAEAGTIALKLNQVGAAFDQKDEFDVARSYYDASSKWYVAANDKDNSYKALVSLAETWAREAQIKSSGLSSSFTAAADFLDRSIHTYRRIATKERATYRVKERISELHDLMSEAGRKSLDEMKAIKTPMMNLEEVVFRSQSSVAGKTFEEALMSFANIYHYIKAKDIRDSTVNSLNQSPLRAMISNTIIARDGRKIGKSPGIHFGAEGTKEYEDSIMTAMIRTHGILVNVLVQGNIIPALEVLLEEHRFFLHDMAIMAEFSPVVPNGRALMFAKGLLAGFDLDFITALHLLVPQVEHMVRWHLKNHGVKTTTLDASGIEMEVGLSALLEKEKVSEIFGDDIKFELEALFTNPFGPNLRNELAHGLLGSDESQSVFSIYIWWWCFKLMFNTFTHAQRETLNSPPTPAEGAGST